ncbi:MAG TPA: hypothetical protein VEN82_03515, partial [Actinomycetota bacterium]|nr:hypothetical protein [Actinomycetota bacterium]
MRVRRISWRTGVISEVAGNSRWGEGADGVKASRSALSYPEAAFALPDGDVGIVDRGNSRIRVIDHLTELIATPAGHDLGDGLPAPSGRMDQPWGIAAGTSGVYVTDGRDVRIRRVDPAGVIHTAAGSGPPCVLAGVAFIAACERDLTDGALATKTGFPPAASGMDLSPEGMLAVTVG